MWTVKCWIDHRMVDGFKGIIYSQSTKLNCVFGTRNFILIK